MAQILSNSKVNTKKSVQKSIKGSFEASNQFKAKDSEKFGAAFKKAINNTNNTEKSTTQSDENVTKEKVLKSKSLEELFDLLNIGHDNGLLMVQAGEEGQAISIDELLNLENLLSILNMDAEQLQKLLNDLLEQDKQATDLWDMLSFVQENGPLILTQFSNANGEQKITPKQSEQFLQLLKFAELAGKQGDLTQGQADQLASIKDLLSQVLGQIQKSSETTASKITLPGFQQVAQQLVTKQQDTNDANVIVQAPTTSKVDTFTITLPTAKPAQSEAFLKEMQALLNKAQLANMNGMTKLAIKLYPENLGSIRIELVQQNGVLTARLLASTALGRELLDQNAHQLKQAFVQQNIQVERLDIAQALQNPERNFRDQGAMNHAFNQQQNEAEEKESEETEDSKSFSDYLKSEGV